MTATTRPVKRALTDLAVFGGRPLFEEPHYVGRPNIGDRRSLQERFDRILDSRWLTNHGRFVQEFELAAARIAGVEHCIATSSATVGLQVALRASRVTGEVLVPSFTFAATAHAAAWQGMTPVFCDVDPDTHCVDPVDAEARITERTTAILAVHLWGRPCAVQDLERIAARHGTTLVFDAAHAFGCSAGGRMVGSFGQAEVFSFHATKFVNSFEGGMIATNDGALAGEIRRMVNFGFSGYDRNAGSVGTNAKMPEICAAMGLTSLESMAVFIERNRENYAAYRDHLRGVAGIVVHAFDEAERNNFQFVVIEVGPDAAISRDDMLALLRAEGIVAQAYCSPAVHEMDAYRTDVPLRLPVSERLAREVLVLPTGTTTTPEDIDGICGLLRYAVGAGEDVTRRLRSMESIT